MNIRQITPQVVAFEFLTVNAFICDRGDGFTLIDAGPARQAERLARAVEGQGINPAAVDCVAITHHHTDHAGGAAGMRKFFPNARIGASAIEAAKISGAEPADRPNGPAPVGFVAALGGRAMYGPMPVCEIDFEFGTGPEPGIEWISAPGHTAGHTMFSFNGVLFVADAATNFFGRLGPPPGLFTKDRASNAATLVGLASRPERIAVFGHGTPLVGHPGDRLATLGRRIGTRL